jgi:dTDP-4-amino-4,6-dideoxygalactose transaminase
MKIPLLDLKAHLSPLREKIIEEVTEVIDSTRYIMGPKVELLENNIAAYCNCDYGIGVSSGTDALIAVLMAMGIGPGDKVLTTPYSFFATMGSIIRVGAEPVFADIDPVSYNIDPLKMEEVLEKDAADGKKIKLLLPVHLYGQCADMTRIMALAAKYNLPVLEDAAQAIGATCPVEENGVISWKRAGAIGTAGCFSFFPSKNLGGIGDGGMVVCNDKELGEKIRIVRMHGAEPKYFHYLMGGNFRLDPIQAVVIDVKLPYLPDWHRARRANAKLYRQLFIDSGLTDNDFVKLPLAVYDSFEPGAEGQVDNHIYNQFVIRVKDRDKLRQFLLEKEIITEIYYPVPLHKQKCVESLGVNELTFPESEKAAAQTLALPIYPELGDDMQQYLVEQVIAFYRS